MAVKIFAPGNLTLRTSLMTLAICCVALLLLSSCRSSGSAQHARDNKPAVATYSKYNIHAQATRRDIKASYAGYVDSGNGHFFIPAGSRLDFTSQRHIGRNGFWFIVVDTGQRVFFEYHQGRMGMGEHEYIEMITSNAPVSLEHFSELDLKGIKAGTVYTGMTKNGVLTALGYPPRHRTPSLESNSWIYWRNRFMTMAVNFDADGTVRSITD